MFEDSICINITVMDNNVVSNCTTEVEIQLTSDNFVGSEGESMENMRTRSVIIRITEDGKSIVAS